MIEKSPSFRRRRLPHAVLVISMFFVASGVLFADQTIDDSIAIIASGEIPQRGSSFVIAVNGRTVFLATAKHVVNGQRSVRVTFPVDRSKEYVGELIQNDSQEDLALLRVTDAPLEVTALAIATDELTIGDEVTIAGFPRRTLVPRYSKTALSSQEGTRLVFFGEVDPGSSGGPVLKDGHVVGLVVSVEGNYPKAIPGATIRRALASWIPDAQLPVAQYQPLIIQGRVFWIDEDGMTRHDEKGVSVRILETGENTTTDDIGFFRVPAPPHPEFKSGQKITLTVGKRGWVIRYPFAGILQIPDRKSEIFQVELVPQGSKVLLSDGQLTNLLEQAARQPHQNGDGKEDPPTRYIADWAARNGFGLDEVRREIHRWSDQILKHSDDAHKKGLAEFANENYLEAEQIFVQSARTWQDELDALAREKQRLADRKSELEKRKARDLELAAGSAYRGLLFDRAIEHYQGALELFPREDHEQDWARVQNNLGNALVEQGTHAGGEEGERLIAESVFAYRSALEIRTRDRFSQDWAMTQNNLGTALSEQGIRMSGEEGRRLLAESVSAYRSSLEVYTHDRLSQDWAMTQNNLGTALNEQGIRTMGEEGRRLLTEAVSAYRSALEIYTRRLLPQHWATTTNNLGTALRNQGVRTGGEEGRRLLAESVSAYRSALEVRIRDLVPQDLAMTQNHLGTALRDQGIRTKGEEGRRMLAESVSTYRSALGGFDRDLLPLRWATTQNNLGMALAQLGTRTEGEEGRRLLAESVSAYRSALEVYTRDRLPQQWAATQNGLGNALSAQGTWTGGVEGRRLLAESVSAYRSALEVFTRDRLFQQWAMTRNNLGTALSEQGIRTDGDKGIKLLAEAAAIFTDLMTAFPGEQSLVLRLVGLYQDFLFEYSAALRTLHSHLETFDADPDLMQALVEVQFTNDLPKEAAALGRRLAEQDRGPLFSMLKAYEAASLVIDGEIPGALGALAQLYGRVSVWPAELQADWEYRGTLHYLEQSEQENRDLLLDLFRTLESENREEILKGLRRIQDQLEALGDGPG